MGTSVEDTASSALQEHGKKINNVKKLFKTVRKHLKLSVLSLQQKDKICRLFETYNAKSVVTSNASQVSGSSRSYSKRSTLSSTDIPLYSSVTHGSSTPIIPDETPSSLRQRNHSNRSWEKRRELAKDDIKKTPPKHELDIKQKLSKSEDVLANPTSGSRKLFDWSHKFPKAKHPQSQLSNNDFSQKRKLFDQASNKTLVQSKRTRYQNQDSQASGRRDRLHSTRQEQQKPTLGVSSPRLIDIPSWSYSNHRKGVHLPANLGRVTTRHIGNRDLSININSLSKKVNNKQGQQLLIGKLGYWHKGEDTDGDIDLRAKREILRWALHRFVHRFNDNIPKEHLQREYLRNLCTNEFTASLRKLIEILQSHNFLKNGNTFNGLYDNLTSPALALKIEQLEKWKKRSVQERIKIKRVTTEKRQMEKNFLSVYSIAKPELEAKQTKIENLQRELANCKTQIFELKRIIRERCAI